MEPSPYACLEMGGHDDDGATAAGMGDPAKPETTGMQAPTIDAGMERGSEKKE